MVARHVLTLTTIVIALTLEAGALPALAAPAAPGSGPRGEPLGPVVHVDLPELGVRILRQKRFDRDTQEVFGQNRLTRNAGLIPLRLGGRLPSDDEVQALIRQDDLAYVSREGAIAPRFLDTVKRMAAEDPTARLTVAAWPNVDPAIVPVRASFTYLQGLTLAQEDAYGRLNQRRMQAAVAATEAPLLAVLSSLGAVNVTPGSICPIVLAEMTAPEILQLGRRTDVVTALYDGSGGPYPTLDVSACAIGATTVHDRGITGGTTPEGSVPGFEVAILEGGTCGLVDDRPYCLRVLASHPRPPYAACLSEHATAVAGVVQSTHDVYGGIAPGVNILSVPMPVWPYLEDSLAWAYDQEGDVFNMSVGSCPDSDAPDWVDRTVDWFVRNMARTVVVSAGNGPNECPSMSVGTPGTAWNVITVGSFNDQGTCSLDDDTMSLFSCYKDPPSPHGDRQKPEVVAPGKQIMMPTVGATGCPTAEMSGTSFSAPHVSGIAALILDRVNVLEDWPEAVKAIIMATATHNLEGAARLSDKDGAGGVRADLADEVADTTSTASGSWYASTLTGVGNVDVTVTVPAFTNRLKIALAWDSNAGLNAYMGGFKDWLDADLDLIVLKDGKLVASSASFDNTYETVDIANPRAGTYTIRIHPYRFDGTEEYIGLAWYLERSRGWRL